MRSLAIILVGAVLSLASGLSALSQVAQRIAPQHAAAVFPNGLAKANLAARLYTLEMQSADDVTLAPSEEVSGLALEALSLEPLADEAMFIAQRALPASRAQEKLALLETAQELTRRSNKLSLDLLQAYADSKRDVEGLQVVDTMLRRETIVHGTILDTLARLGGDVALHPAIVELLKGDPPWASQFWRQLAQSPEGLQGAAKLWDRNRRAGGTVDPELERLLVAGLAGVGRYDEAAQVAATMSGRKVSEGSFFTEEFSGGEPMTPFAWTLTSTGDYGADIVQADNRLLISALAGSRGIAASQTVRLGPGRYRIDIAIEDAGEATIAEGLSLMAICRAPGQARLLLNRPVREAPVTFEAGECRWADIGIFVAVPSDADARDWTIQSVSIREVAGAG